MHNARFRVMAGVAGATLCLFAATAYGQNPTPDNTVPPAGSVTPDAQAPRTASGTEINSGRMNDPNART